jgi:hypothetical protein
MGAVIVIPRHCPRNEPHRLHTFYEDDPADEDVYECPGVSERTCQP